MKTLKHIIIICLFTIGSQKVQAQNYSLDTKKSALSWTGKAAFNSYALTGMIIPKKGNLTITDDTISFLHLVINMKSIDHENKDLKNHLKHEDFFEVKTYPEAVFNINKGVIINNNAILKGELTIKGKTNPENIPIIIERNKLDITIRFNYAINRTKYGVNHNSPSIFKQMKENAIADEFTLKGTFVFTQ